jgi:hypothetical protein
MGIHPQLANVDLAVYGDLAVGRDVIIKNPPARRRAFAFFSGLFPKICSLGVCRGNALIGSCAGGSKVSLKT